MVINQDDVLATGGKYKRQTINVYIAGYEVIDNLVLIDLLRIPLISELMIVDVKSLIQLYE